ncbi:ABC transporter I family member 17-like protein [Drosera capensis]
MWSFRSSYSDKRSSSRHVLPSVVAPRSSVALVKRQGGAVVPTKSIDHHVGEPSGDADHIQDEAREHLLLNIEDVDDSIANGNGFDSSIKFRVKGLTKESDSGQSILNGVTVDIPKGMIVGVMGPSGSGKSTFLRALNRMWEPPAGTVFLDGEDVCILDPLELRRKVGMLFQLPALFEGTVADNVRYGPQLKRTKLSDEEVYKLLTLADLDPSFYSKGHNEMSVGQAQRVALARTLANQPEVLLLDEPTSALDPISTQNIEDAVLKLKKSRGMTVIMVSHSIKQIQRIADVVLLLVDGSVVEVLKPDNLKASKHPMALRFLELSN